MSSFSTHRRRGVDPELPAYRRLSNLRSCILHFSPYGFRSTYFYLTISAGLPRNIDADPASLVRATDELHEARTIWRAGIEPLQQQRREAKRQGNRFLPDVSWWSSYGNTLTDSPDPCRYPDMTLAAFVRRQIARASGVGLPGCPSCGDEREPVSYSTGHGFIDRCRQCGVLVRPCRCGARHWEEASRFATLWKGIWERQHMGDDGRPNPRWPGWADS